MTEDEDANGPMLYLMNSSMTYVERREDDMMCALIENAHGYVMFPLEKLDEIYPTLVKQRDRYLESIGQAVSQPRAMDKNEEADWLAEAIGDSIDVDWSYADGARSIQAAMERDGLALVKAGAPADAARHNQAVAPSLASVWQQARENHEHYSATGDTEQDIRFFGLGLAGEAGEVANFIKKRWRDGDGHDADLRAECADVFAYNIMLADALGMSPSDLISEVARKQQVFIEKMKAREADAFLAKERG